MSEGSPTEQIAPEPKGSMAADFSLILGVLSNFLIWVIGSIPAIILGIIAIRNINRNPTTVTGKGRAIAGIITACTGLLIAPFLVPLILFGSHGHRHPDASRAKCILQMTTIEKLMISYGNLNDFQPEQPVLVQALVDEEYIGKLPACPKGGIYTYTGKMPSGDAGSAPYTKCSIESHDFDPWKQTGVDGQSGTASTVEIKPITEAEVTAMILEQTILPEYSVNDLSLREALAILQSESEKYGKLAGYEPVQFHVDDYYSKKKVTLITKHNSMKIICESISQQVMLQIKYEKSKVTFWEGDTDIWE